MRLKLIEFQNTNKVLLPGLLYEPDRASNSIVIALHGNGSSGGMYNVEKNNAIANALTSKNISYLTFSNTGAHLIQKFDILENGTRKRGNFGVAYELIKDCIYDIDGAVEYVKELGYTNLILLGQSTGANKICVYNKFKKANPFMAYILTSGGDDSGIFYKQVGAKKFKEIISKCKGEHKKGKGRNIVAKYVTPMIISYDSLFDQIDPDGEYNTFPFYWVTEATRIMKKQPFSEYTAIDKPCLVIYGENDEYCHNGAQHCLDLLKQAASLKTNFTYQLIKDTDHSFTNCESELAELISNWINI
jgi:alpha-beta hydrolase superfamily lysophospholipase